MLKSQHNAWIHVCATIGVVAASLFFDVLTCEWCWLVLAIMAIWTAEALETAFEFLADVTSPNFHPLIKKSKDVSAGAVLISAVGSVIIDILIFGPHLLNLMKWEWPTSGFRLSVARGPLRLKRTVGY